MVEYKPSKLSKYNENQCIIIENFIAIEPKKSQYYIKININDIELDSNINASITPCDDQIELPPCFTLDTIMNNKKEKRELLSIEGIIYVQLINITIPHHHTIYVVK